MSRESLNSLAEELRLQIEGKNTIMRTAVDVVELVALTLYYLSAEGHMRKQLMLLGFHAKLCRKLSGRCVKP